MAETPPRRIYLSDLVMAVLLCGTVMAAFTAPWDAKQKIAVAAGVVGIVWYLIRQRRSAPICDECGARFFPQKGEDAAANCPHCGESQSPLRQPPVRISVILCLTALLIAMFAISIFATALARSGANPHHARSWQAPIVIAFGCALLCGPTLAWLIRTRSRTAQLTRRICESCGEPIPAKPIAPRVCPNCRSRKLTDDALKQEQKKTNRTLLITLGVFAIVGGSVLVNGVRSAATTGISALLFVFVPGALFFAVVVWLLARSLIHTRRVNAFLGETKTLSSARACAGEEGTVATDGLRLIWYSGPNEPVLMLREEYSAAHDRIATFLGESNIPDPTLHILCFHDRAALLRLYQSVFPGLNLSEQLGIFMQPPWNVMTLCTTPVAGRLDDPRALARSLFATVLLFHEFAQFSAPWRQAGITRALAATRTRADLVGLNRRMLAARSEGMEWSEELFTTSATKFYRMFMRTKDTKSIRRSEQFVDQAWSIVEFLAGENAPESRRTAFRAFLRDKHASSRRREQAFSQHFGFGFGSFFDEWREWVTGQGIGPDLPPQPRIRDALQTRVLPVIRDGQASPSERIQAIRNWRVAGTPLGAPALIDLLRDPGDIPKDEIIWALCGASGISCGDDPDRWQAWWETVRSAVEAPELA